MPWLTALLFLAVSVILVALVLKISAHVNERLNQMNLTLQEANKIIGQNLGNTTQIFGSVQEKLGKLEEVTRSIFDVGKDISSLQDLLRAPKFRGQMGEALLENLLSQILPNAHFKMQYRFRSGEAVDAVLNLGGRLVPVDAKFSLENFQKMQSTENEQEKNSFRRKFLQDVKMRIDEIAAKYILPEENTYDFALMYIPAENIYYEVIIKEDIYSYCLSKKVVPVSPNTFYAYLQVICLGLKGLKIEENAREILANLGMLNNEMTKFKEDFSLLGGHLANALRKYEDSHRKLEKFSDKLINIQDSRRIESK